MKRFLLLLTLCLCGGASRAQEHPETAAFPRVAVTLSGGGARGFAHIGVLKVFEEAGVPVDLITGTSMGSVVGVLYASGYTAGELEALTLGQDWKELLQDGYDRQSQSMVEKWDSESYVFNVPFEKGRIRIPSGVKPGQNLTFLLAQLLAMRGVGAFEDLAIPFACIATDLRSYRPVRLVRGPLVEAVRASMAIPGVFTPVDLEGRRLVDGGVVRNLPVQEAREMGADFVIAVDLSRGLDETDALDSAIEILMQTSRIPRARGRDEQRALADVLIEPDVRSLSVLDFDQLGAIMAEGEKAARAMLPQIQTLLDSIYVAPQERPLLADASGGVPVEGRRPRAPRPTPRAGSVVDFADMEMEIDSIEVTGLKQGAEDLIRVLIPHQARRGMTWRVLRKVIKKIYATQRFETVTPLVLSLPDGRKRLVLKIKEKARQHFRGGIHLNSRLRPNVLLNITWRSPARYHTLSLDAELGRRKAAQARYVMDLGSGFGLRTTVRGEQTTLVQEPAPDQSARLRSRMVQLSTMLTHSVDQTFLCGVGIEQRYRHLASTAGDAAFSSLHDRQTHLVGLAWFDTYDRAVFPRSGQHIFYRVAGGALPLERSLSGVEQRFDWRAALPVGARLSMITEAQFYSTTIPAAGEAAALTASKQQAVALPGTGSRLGGAYRPLLEIGSFVGLGEQELTGRHMKALMAGAQYEVTPRHFIVVRANVGELSDTWNWTFGGERYVAGVGLTLGRLTALGPMQITLASSTHHAFLVDLSLGPVF